jgi:hypothetical protein
MINASSTTDFVPGATGGASGGEPRTEICCACLPPSTKKQFLGTLPKLCIEKWTLNLDENVVGEAPLAAGTTDGECT